MTKPRICLNMIVKDEAHVIERCLASVIPHITSWCISDTGSTDNTIEVIENVMAKAGLPGKVVQHKWFDFGSNRTLALRDAERVAQDTECDYYLFLDADEQLGGSGDVALSNLTHDLYQVTTEYGSIEYARTLLASTTRCWKWVGVLHEYLAPEAGALPTKAKMLDPSLRLKVNSDGARSQDPEKYVKDIHVLERELERDPHNPRTVFYLAQCNRDAGNAEIALVLYRRRSKMGGWEQEVWYSLLQCGLLNFRLGNVDSGILDLEAAARAIPTRLEPVMALVSYYRATSQWKNARFWASAAYASVQSGAVDSSGLFYSVEDNTWRPADEYSLALYYTGNKELGGQILTELLKDSRTKYRILDEAHSRLVDNSHHFSLDSQ